MHPVPHPFAIAILLCAASVSAQPAGTIRDAAAAVGLNFGLAVSSYQVRDSAASAAAAKAQFNMVVCENEMKFESTENPTGTFRFSGGDAVSGFAVANGMRMRGHSLISFSASRPATGSMATRDTFLTIMRNHIEAVGGHFRAKVLEWDVLNEAMTAGKNTFWNTIGEDYPDSAMAISRRVLGTDGYLYYNEQGADGINEKSNAINDLGKRWLARKVPVDGFGFECHLRAGFDKNDISANIKRFGDLGLRVSLTQVDIRDGSPQDWANLMDACLENFNCVSFVTWGLSDETSWLGSGCACLLYEGNPPTAKAAMIQAVLEAISRADPMVAETRKLFAAIPPGSLGLAVPASIAPFAAFSEAGSVSAPFPIRIYALRNGKVTDVLGRNRRPTPIPTGFQSPILPAR